MKILIKLFILFSILMLSFSCAKENSSESKVVLIINETQITLAQFKDELRNFSKQFDATRPLDENEKDELKKILLNNLVEKELIAQEAKKEGIIVTDDELDNKIKDILTNYTKKRLKYTLHSKDVNFSLWREKIRSNLLIEKLIETKIDKDLSVSEKELKVYYRENEADFISSMKVHASQIVVSSESEANLAKLRLSNGEDFARIAKEMSISPEGKTGGDLGVFSKGQMPEDFNIVFNLKPDEITNIIKTPYGYHIFKLIKKIKKNKETFEQVKATLEKKIFQEKQKKLFSEWLNNLKHNSDIKINNYLL